MVEQAAPSLVPQTSSVILLALPANANTEIQSAMGQDVNCGCHLCEHDRPSERRDQDIGPETDPVSETSQISEHRERIQPMPVGARWLFTPARSSLRRIGVRCKILAEDHVV